MADKNHKTETKRLPKGQRTHARRLKQAARKEIGTNNPQPQRTRAEKKAD